MSDTNELLRSKHAFGNSNNIDAALLAGKIDAFDVLFLDSDTDPKIGWIDGNGNKVIVKPNEDEVVRVKGESLPTSGEEGKIYIFGEDGYFWDGTKFVNLCKPTDVSALETQVAGLETEMKTKVDATAVQTMIEEYSESVIAVVEF